MEWVQSESDKQQGREFWYLTGTGWYASVHRVEDRTGVLPDKYSATIGPRTPNAAKYAAESYEEVISNLQEAQRWAELEMSLDRRI
jgi:hypothetical protein